MRSLAEVIMKGRVQATLVAMISMATVVLAWVGSAAIALVILRKGIAQGAGILMWALLPAIAVAVWGDTGPLSSLLGAAVTAAVLRLTVSWPWALAAASVCGLLTSVGLMTIGRNVLDDALRLLTEMMSELPQLSDGAGSADSLLPSAQSFAGQLGLSNAFVVVLCVLLARWWQSVLYNPGGFQLEFLQLRLPVPLMLVLVAGSVVLSLLGSAFMYWALIPLIPLVFAGFGLVHAVVAMKRIGTVWIVMFYVGWLLLDPIKIGLLLVTVADSFTHFRARLSSGR